MNNLKKLAILGAGSFGSALAEVAARQGQAVTLWTRDEDRATSINENHTNPDYFHDFILNDNIVATSDIKEALHEADWVIIAVPSQTLREILKGCASYIKKIPLVLAAKGIENETLMTLDEVVVDVLGQEWKSLTFALSGPSFAKEIMQDHPTAVVLAGVNSALGEQIAALLFSKTFRVYTSTDIVGVQLGGALKNVIAIAAGAVLGLGFGHNTRVTLITRGLAEITRIAVAKGANPLTLSGLAGMGDLVLTCTGALSRNRAVGQALGEGKSLEEALKSVKHVAEGVRTTESAYNLAKMLGVEAPITGAVYKVLYENLPIVEAVNELVSRKAGSELEFGD